MKTGLLLLICIGFVVRSDGKAYYAGKREMIQKADAIVIANVVRVKKTEKKTGHWTYRQKATAVIERTLKGSVSGKITLYGMESFICASCTFSEGKYILFLRPLDDGWSGSNWNMGIRPVSKGRVAWFDNSANRFGPNSVPLELAVEEIEEVIDEQVRFSENLLWGHLSADATDLTIYEEVKIDFRCYEEIQAGNGFSKLKSLSIRGAFNPEHLACFSNAPIEYLNLHESVFSDDALSVLLPNLHELKTLDVSGSNFSDKELSSVDGKQLNRLVMYNTQVTDLGLAAITNFPSLEYLNLNKHSNKGYQYLSQVDSLKDLIISGGVTDETFIFLQDLGIENLWIDGDRLTNKGISALGGFKDLRIIHLPGATMPGIERFKENHPKVQVKRF